MSRFTSDDLAVLQSNLLGKYPVTGLPATKPATIIRKRKGKTPAQALTATIRQWLELNGWLVWRNGAAAMKIEGRFVKTGTPGLPDLMCVRQAVFMCVEIKAGKDTMSDAQIDWRGRFERMGVLYVEAHSLDQVILALRQFPEVAR